MSEDATGSITAADLGLGQDQLLQFYREMLLIRRFEERAGQLYGMGYIGGFCHLYIGQEAVITGIQHALQPGDSVITGYREHGHILAAGTSPVEVMAELTGRATGVSKGKGGSMHMFDVARGFYGGHGIVGATVPLGAGLAFAHKYREDGGIAVAFFGDGAANQGQVYETFNMAELWELPILFIVENNQYAMGTSVERASAETKLHRRGSSFRIPGKDVDGMNVLEVYGEAKTAIDSIRAGEGPQLLEMETYRYRGHSMSDPAKYRTREEVDTVREEHDPINQLAELLKGEFGVTESALGDINENVRRPMNSIQKWWPDHEYLYPDARFVAHHGRGHRRQMARQRRGYSARRRPDCRD
jgi:pyruvate dehydrogenase E1 component alpha subunit